MFESGETVVVVDDNLFKPESAFYRQYAGKVGVVEGMKSYGRYLEPTVLVRLDGETWAREFDESELAFDL